MKKTPASELVLPLMALRGLVAFPGMILHFDVGRERSVAAVEKAMENDGLLFAVAQKDPAVEFPDRGDLHDVGTVIHVKSILRSPDGTLRVVALGKVRAALLEADTVDGVPLASFRPIPAKDPAASADTEIAAMARMIKQGFAAYAAAQGDIPPGLVSAVEEERDAETLCDCIALNLFSDAEDRQRVLAARSLKARCRAVIQTLEREQRMLEFSRELHSQVHDSIDKNQKQYFLREQLHVIRSELGEDEESDTEQLRARLDASPMQGEARRMAERELSRMEHMAPGTPEISVARSYVEFLLDMPWQAPEEKPFRVDSARKILERDHFGLEKVKERVLEYLAVRSLNPAIKTPILCLVGAPGVGKTSIAHSIAEALGRKFARMSLGGLHDEAEIRGHRRTYIGAMPGRILSLVRQAGVTDPVLLLDEIDKLTSDMRGDPASALLEALDPEQNSTFSDHYAEAPYDLSHVLFITTANTSDTIPAPLLDRMEVIEVPSYTLEEKVQIAKRHLWPRQLANHALTRSQVRISESVLREVIEGYTAEAGVRALERQLGAILRKVAVRLLETPEAERKPVNVTRALLEETLGAPTYITPAAGREPETGVVNGLAWTSVGGKTLSVEATVMPGSGALELTGQLGDVMRESAKAAYSYIRSRSDVYSIAEDFHSHNDVHVHVPEGAVPKDGPSAGVALTCAMLSAITGKPARQDVAMTGEITLRGKVLPIGGVKEKLLAAYRMGMTTVLLPEDNRKDLREIPEEIRRKLDVRTITGVDQAIRIVLGGGK